MLQSLVEAWNKTSGVKQDPTTKLPLGDQPAPSSLRRPSGGLGHVSRALAMNLVPLLADTVMQAATYRINLHSTLQSHLARID